MRGTPDPEELELTASLVGRTIVNASLVDTHPDPDDEWAGHEELTLTLDDGRKIQIAGWGYDAWGIFIEQVES